MYDSDLEEDKEVEPEYVYISGDKVYQCNGCPYRNREVDSHFHFCGWCMRKILDDGR